MDIQDPFATPPGAPLQLGSIALEDGHTLIDGTGVISRDLAISQLVRQGVSRGDNVIFIGGYGTELHTPGRDTVNTLFRADAAQWDIQKDLTTREDVETYMSSRIGNGSELKTNLDKPAMRLLVDVTHTLLQESARESRLLTPADVHAAMSDPAVLSNERLRQIAGSAGGTSRSPEDEEYLKTIGGDKFEIVRAMAAQAISDFKYMNSRDKPRFSLQEFQSAPEGREDRPQGKLLSISADAQTLYTLKHHMTGMAKLALDGGGQHTPQQPRTLLVMEDLNQLGLVDNLPQALAESPRESNTQVVMGSSHLPLVKNTHSVRILQAVIAHTDNKLFLRSGLNIDGGGNAAGLASSLIQEAVEYGQPRDTSQGLRPPAVSPHEMRNLQNREGRLIRTARNDAGEITSQDVQPIHLDVEVPRLSRQAPTIVRDVAEAARQAGERGGYDAVIRRAHSSSNGLADVRAAVQQFKAERALDSITAGARTEAASASASANADEAVR